jgi:radical SAM protein with 4Fe4S-binding SPASM domain
MIPYTQLRKDARLDLAQAVPLSAPLTVYVEPTNRCNLSCAFCPQSLEDYKERAGYWEHMPIELFRKVTAEIAVMGIKSLKLYFFGEPLLHPQIGEIMFLSHQVCDRVELTTNGMALTSAKALEMVTAPLDYLRVSIYQDVRHPENVVRNVKALWSCRTILGSKKPYICVKVFNREQEEAIRRDYEGICDEIAIEGLHTIGSDLVQFGGHEVKHKACPYPFYNLVVKSNGDVVPCCVAWEKSLVVGNVKDESLADIWRGDKLAVIHRLHLEGRRRELAACAQCDTPYNSPDSVDALSVDEYERRRANERSC